MSSRVLPNSQTFSIDLLLVATWTESLQGCSEDLERLRVQGLYHKDSNLSHVVGEILGLVWTPNFEIVESRDMTHSDKVSYTTSALDRLATRSVLLTQDHQC